MMVVVQRVRGLTIESDVDLDVIVTEAHVASRIPLDFKLTSRPVVGLFDRGVLFVLEVVIVVMFEVFDRWIR